MGGIPGFGFDGCMGGIGRIGCPGPGRGMGPGMGSGTPNPGGGMARPRGGFRGAGFGAGLGAGRFCIGPGEIRLTAWPSSDRNFAILTP